MVCLWDDNAKVKLRTGRRWDLAHAWPASALSQNISVDGNDQLFTVDGNDQLCVFAKQNRYLGSIFRKASVEQDRIVHLHLVISNKDASVNVHSCRVDLRSFCFQIVPP